MCTILIAALLWVGISSPLIAAPIFYEDIPNNVTPPEEWSKLKNEHGLDIYVAITTFNGQSYLKIKFENPQSKAIAFSWSLSENNQVLIEGLSHTLASHSTMEIFDQTLLFEATSATLTHFSITTTLNN